MTAEQLKASVLQMAIEGRLVPQLEEEPAVSLDVEEPDDVPFAIPEKWKWVRLGEVGSWKAGATPNRTKSEYYINGTIPWLKTGELTDGFISEVSEYITEKAVNETSVRINPIGSVMVAMYGATIGKLGILNISCATNQACCACIAYNNIIENIWLFYYLLSQRSNLIGLGAGGAQPNISKQKIISYLIPLPPLEEQRRIVARLDEILPLIESYGKAHDALEAVEKALPGKLRASLLQEAISGRLVPQLDEEPAVSLDVEEPDDVPFAIPEKWKWVRIRELVIPCSQKVPDKKFNYIDVASIDNKKHKLGEVKITFPENAPSRARKIVKNGMVIYSTVRPYLLNTCIINGNFSDEIICSTAFVAVECKNILLNEYFLNVLISPYFCEYVKDIQRGVAYPAITDKGFYSAPFPLPPLEEQRRIVARLNELLPCVDAMAKLHDGEKR